MKLTVEQYDAIEKCVNKILENRKLVDAPKEDPEAWREEYRKKQEAGVKYECQNHGTMWTKGNWTFTGPKEIYREEAPQEPHAAERALWKAQRDAGTNEVWQVHGVADIQVDIEPRWHPDFIYRVKPMKLTAVIVRKWSNWDRLQDWQFTGTREEYRAECEKYGYVVISEIKEVKPKTVKNYSVLVRLEFPTIEAANDYVKGYGMDIIGNIEEREIEI